MLALTRKKQEALMINNNIEITILDIRGDQVKIGISAPKDVSIYRKEVYLQIQESNKEAMRDVILYLKEQGYRFGSLDELRKQRLYVIFCVT